VNNTLHCGRCGGIIYYIDLPELEPASAQA